MSSWIRDGAKLLRIDGTSKTDIFALQIQRDDIPKQQYAIWRPYQQD